MTQGFSEVHNPTGEQGTRTKSVFCSEKSATILLKCSFKPFK